MLDLISKPSQQATGIYLVRAGDRTLYVGHNFNPNQRWLSDLDYQKLMGWDQVQVEFLSCSIDQVRETKPQSSNSELF